MERVHDEFLESLSKSDIEMDGELIGPLDESSDIKPAEAETRIEKLGDDPDSATLYIVGGPDPEQ